MSQKMIRKEMSQKINEQDFIVLKRDLSFTFAMPESCVWDFIREFGEKFPKIGLENKETFRQVDSYKKGNEFFGWIIRITVDENSTKQDFSRFIKKFIREKNLNTGPNFSLYS